MLAHFFLPIHEINYRWIIDANRWAYNPSKAAVTMLSKSFVKSLAPRNIATNVVCPGLFLTKMNSFIAEEKVWSGAASMNPLKRNGLPADMAGLVVFLCSRAGSYVNGAVIPVDGGMVTGAN